MQQIHNARLMNSLQQRFLPLLACYSYRGALLVEIPDQERMIDGRTHAQIEQYLKICTVYSATLIGPNNDKVHNRPYVGKHGQDIKDANWKTDPKIGQKHGRNGSIQAFKDDPKNSWRRWPIGNKESIRSFVNNGQNEDCQNARANQGKEDRCQQTARAGATRRAGLLACIGRPERRISWTLLIVLLGPFLSLCNPHHGSRGKVGLFSYQL